MVVFLHGWFAVNPAFYGAWIDHLVRIGPVGGFSPLSERRGNAAGRVSAQRDGGHQGRRWACWIAVPSTFVPISTGLR